MFEEIGDRFFAHGYVRIGDIRYSTIKATTWKELAEPHQHSAYYPDLEKE